MLFNVIKDNIDLVVYLKGFDNEIKRKQSYCNNIYTVNAVHFRCILFAAKAIVTDYLYM